MRPLFAIAPLALFLVLINPTPTGGPLPYGGFRFRTPSTESLSVSDTRREPVAVIKPAVLVTPATFTTLQQGKVVDASFRR